MVMLPQIKLMVRDGTQETWQHTMKRPYVYAAVDLTAAGEQARTKSPSVHQTRLDSLHDMICYLGGNTKTHPAALRAATHVFLSAMDPARNDTALSLGQPRSTTAKYSFSVPDRDTWVHTKALGAPRHANAHILNTQAYRAPVNIDATFFLVE